MKRWRKTVIAGPLVKIIEYTRPLPRDDPYTRHGKQRAATEIRKKLNLRTAQEKLETKLAANFTSNDFFVTFTYRPGDEPKKRKEAARHKTEYLRRLRKARSRRGQPLKWAASIENKHGEGRYHIHAIINSTGAEEDIEELCFHWIYGHVNVSRLFDAKHDNGENFNTWAQIARYMAKERPEDGPDTTPNGAQVYSCSRNLKGPVITAEWVEGSDNVIIPPGAVAVSRDKKENEFGDYYYYSYMTDPLKPCGK